MTLEFATSPGIWLSYSRVVAARKPATMPAGKSAPRIEATLAAVRPDPSHLARYAELCEVSRTDVVPIAYPHMLASGMHLAMLSSPAFPIGVLGLVHLRNRIVRERPQDVNEPMALRSWIEGHRDTEWGQEFDLETEGQVDGHVAWRETCTFLARGRARPGARAGTEKPPEADSAGGGVVVTSTGFAAPAGLGRRYASVSGDYNPIHLADFTARPFGFRRAIAHGMWSLARCAAELGEADMAGSATLDVNFMRPVYLPAWVILESRASAAGTVFTLKDSAGNKPYLAGELRATAA
ncbi:MAG: MaoC family dehydratase [Steroidobacteraceae bacterium]